MKITHLVLWVQENKLSEKFYKKLGFAVIRSDEGHSTVRLNGFEVQLVNMRDEELFARDAMSSDRGRGVYIYICVNDVDKMYMELFGRGIMPATEPRNWEWGNREFIVKDPDDYKLCFWQPVTER